MKELFPLHQNDSLSSTRSHLEKLEATTHIMRVSSFWWPHRVKSRLQWMTAGSHSRSSCPAQMRLCTCPRSLGACNTAIVPMRCFSCLHQTPTTELVIFRNIASFANSCFLPGANDRFVSI